MNSKTEVSQQIIALWHYVLSSQLVKVAFCALNCIV
jgi:hypothetical protein